jgi:hypothetical protein
MKFFIYIILIIPTIISAQVPGYQGKRFSIDGDFLFMSALLNPNSNLNNGYKSFNTRYNMNINYVLSRDAVLELTAGMFNTGWKHSFTEKIVDPNYSNVISYSDLYKVKSKTIGFSFKFFRESKGSIAPNGYYFKVGSLFVMNDPTYVRPFETDGLVSTNRQSPTNMVLFTCGFGKQTILANRFLFRYGIEFGMSPTVMVNAAKVILKPDNSYYEGGEKGYSLNERVLLENLININLGLGILIF